MANTQGLFGGAAQGNLNSVPLPQKQTLSSNFVCHCKFAAFHIFHGSVFYCGCNIAYEGRKRRFILMLVRIRRNS